MAILVFMKKGETPEGFNILARGWAGRKGSSPREPFLSAQPRGTSRPINQPMKMKRFGFKPQKQTGTCFVGRGVQDASYLAFNIFLLPTQSAQV